MAPLAYIGCKGDVWSFNGGLGVLAGGALGGILDDEDDDLNSKLLPPNFVFLRISSSNLAVAVVGAADDGGEDHLSFFSFPTPMDRLRLSMGNGNTMVELCSVEMAFSVCK